MCQLLVNWGGGEGELVIYTKDGCVGDFMCV